MYSSHKHSYLQSQTQDINPRLINRSVTLARSQLIDDGHDFEPPYQRLCSEQPCIPIPNIDITRRPLAFGKWALPKLSRELHHQDNKVVLAALSSILDLVQNPEKLFEALRLRIPNRMADLLVHVNSPIRERTCMALTALARIAEGKAAIIRNKDILKNLCSIIAKDFAEVRFKAAILLEQLSSVWMFADALVDAGFITLLLSVIQQEEEAVIEVHLDTLKHLMYGEGKLEAVENKGFEVFAYLLNKGNETIISKAATCLMMVTSVAMGKEIAYNTEILVLLNSLLHSEIVEIYTSAASAIMFCTIKSRAKFRALEQPGLCERLVTLTNDWHHPNAQMFSIKALTNMCEHPTLRRNLHDDYLEQLEKIVVGDNENLKRYKESLLRTINWVPWVQPS